MFTDFRDINAPPVLGKRARPSSLCTVSLSASGSDQSSDQSGHLTIDDLSDPEWGPEEETECIPDSLTEHEKRFMLKICDEFREKLEVSRVKASTAEQRFLAIQAEYEHSQAARSFGELGVAKKTRAIHAKLLKAYDDYVLVTQRVPACEAAVEEVVAAFHERGLTPPPPVLIEFPAHLPRPCSITKPPPPLPPYLREARFRPSRQHESSSARFSPAC